MAPRSARKRKCSDTDGSVVGRRKKREDTPMKTSRETDARTGIALATSDDASARVSLSTTDEPNVEQPQDNFSLSLDPDESQLNDSPITEAADELLPLVLETQYEEDEDGEGLNGDGILAADEGYMAYTGTENHDDTNLEETKEDEGTEGGLSEQDDVVESDTRDSLVGASASIEEILQQLAEVASNFMTSYQELTSEGDVIQLELNQLNEAQEARCAKMLGRLERAGNSIFSFGQQHDDSEFNIADDTEAGMTESQV